MIATMERTTADPVTATDPTVTYDLLTQQITVTVIVSWKDKLIVAAPPLSVPGSGTAGGSATWTVLWNLVPDITLKSACFSSKGIEIPTHIPLGVSIRMWEPKLAPEEWQVTIENGVENAGIFSYSLYVTGTLLGGTSVSIKHDPTIAVVPDPIT